jgi:hypothetical protein
MSTSPTLPTAPPSRTSKGRRLALLGLVTLFGPLQVLPNGACRSWRAASPEPVEGPYADGDRHYQVVTAGTGVAADEAQMGWDARGPVGGATPAPAPAMPSPTEPSASGPMSGESSLIYGGDMTTAEEARFRGPRMSLSDAEGAARERSEESSKLPGKLAGSTSTQTDSGGGGSAGGGRQGALGGQVAEVAVSKRPAKPLVVYQGYLKMRVRHLRQAVDAAVSIAEKAGGYVESLGKRVVIVRVPASDFERVMDLFATLGNVLDRRTEAYDVTARYRDTLLRLEVAEAAKERLLALLERTTDPDERLRIVREVKRLSEEIEGMASTLATLKNLVDYFTVTLELEPVTDSQAPQGRTSPFPWVRNLTPHQATLFPAGRAFAFDLPAGFVRFDRSLAFRAQAADTTTIRVGEGRNDPIGDSAFWARALDHEMTARDEARVEEGSAGPLTFRVWRDKDLAPRYYLVGVQATDVRVYVVEVFFPNEEAWQQHRDAVVKALASFREEA